MNESESYYVCSIHKISCSVQCDDDTGTTYNIPVLCTTADRNRQFYCAAAVWCVCDLAFVQTVCGMWPPAQPTHTVRTAISSVASHRHLACLCCFFASLSTSPFADGAFAFSFEVVIPKIEHRTLGGGYILGIGM
jgi:hypothetical protein